MSHRISQPETQAAHEQEPEGNPQHRASAKGQLGVTSARGPTSMLVLWPALPDALFGLPAVGFFFVKNSARQNNPALRIFQRQGIAKLTAFTALAFPGRPTL